MNIRNFSLLVTILGLTFLLPKVSPAAVVEVSAFQSAQETGAGSVVVNGIHLATVSLIDADDKKKAWSLAGRLVDCHERQDIAHHCIQSATLDRTIILQCHEQGVTLCADRHDGFRALSAINYGFSSLEWAHELECMTLRCQKSYKIHEEGTGTYAAPVPTPAQRAHLTDWKFAVTIEGDGVPMYVVVSHFFLMAFAEAQSSQSSFERFLRDLGIDPDRPAADLFRQAMDRSYLALQEPSFYSWEEGDAFMKRQHELLKNKVVRVDGIYRVLLTDLEKHGISAEKIEKFCEEKIRPVVKIYSTERDNSDYFKILAAFDAPGGSAD